MGLVAASSPLPPTHTPAPPPQPPSPPPHSTPPHPHAHTRAHKRCCFGSGYDPEEVECQKLPAAISCAWRRLEQQPQPKPQQQPAPSPDSPSGGAEEPGAAEVAATAAVAVLVAEPPTEEIHTHHSAFGAPFCTWRPPLGPGPSGLPPLHDVLVGVMRVCWARHDDREPSRNVIYGTAQHRHHDDPTTAYMCVRAPRVCVCVCARDCACVHVCARVGGGPRGGARCVVAARQHAAQGVATRTA